MQPKRGDVVLVAGPSATSDEPPCSRPRRLGARVIAGVRASQKAEAQSLGAEQVVALDDDAEMLAFPARRHRTNLIVGGSTIAKLIPKIRKGGTLASVVGEPTAAKGRDLRVRAFVSHPDGKRLARPRSKPLREASCGFPSASASSSRRCAMRIGLRNAAPRERSC